MKVLQKFSLNGKSTLITGGTKGFGKEMAKVLGEAGAEVAIIDREKSSGENRKKELFEKKGKKIIFIKGDVRKFEDIENFVKVVEWSKYNITVNCISPGVFNTSINEKILNDPEIKKFFLEKTPVGRIGNPEEIGPLFVFLASDACPFITGSVILIDGG
ncbi:MAG: SDR family NAD(P)-dependent oxidoreductase [Candidatus Ratteibacteria bacterium]